MVVDVQEIECEKRNLADDEVNEANEANEAMRIILIV